LPPPRFLTTLRLCLSRVMQRGLSLGVWLCVCVVRLLKPTRDCVSVYSAGCSTFKQRILRSSLQDVISVIADECDPIAEVRTPRLGKIKLELKLQSLKRLLTLGHTSTPFCFVIRQFLGFFPGQVHLSEVSLDDIYSVFLWSSMAFSCNLSVPSVLPDESF